MGSLLAGGMPHHQAWELAREQCGISSSATQGALCNMAEPRDPADTGAWLARIYGTT
jgi:hypothetical protein